MTTAVEDKTEGTVDLAANSVMLTLRTGKPGNRRRVRRETVASEVEVDADKDSIGVSKDLLASPSLQAIAAHDRDTRRRLYMLSLPAFGTLRDGVYRVPLTLTDEVEEYLQERSDARDALVKAFMPTYEAAVTGARDRLRALFDAGDYPPAAAVEATFFMSWAYMVFGTPGNLSATLFKKEQSKAAAVIGAEVEELRQVLRQAFADILDHAVGRLAVGKDGQKVVFGEGMVKGMEDFFAYFNARNLVGDTELADLVGQARAVMSGVKTQDLRTMDDVRGQVRDTLAGLKGTMDDNLMLKPVRRVDRSRLDD